MKPIDRFILHVVHNWKNELNEAYSEKAIQGFINKFKEEADDLNVNITDDQLRAYINTFDRIKEKLPGDQRDLNKWTLTKFIRLVSATKSDEAAEEIDITPDVVYHNDNNTIVIYNGSKQDNCIRYGNGEKWCITRSAFPNYRYNEDRGYPTFYLAKNNNISDSDKLSFVAIQVRNPGTTSEDDRYVYTNRNNSPHESEPMNFNQLLREVPWLNEVPNIKSILKYIPLSSQEKITQQYGKKPISYREWAKLPYSVKEQYLVVRSSTDKIFSDIDVDTFAEKYLPKYPELAKFIAETPGIINSIILLKNLDKFPNQIRRSITANVQEKIKTEYLSTDVLPFDVKKLLVQLNKWNLNPDERLYINKEGDTIVKLTLGDDIKVGLYQDEDDFPSIKINKRTSKYLLDYPELDKIPLNTLLKLAKDNIINKNLITKILNDAQEDPNSAIVVKSSEDGNVILDSNSFSSYKMDKNGNITSIPFNNEEVQQIFAGSKDNEAFQQNALNVFKLANIPPTIDKDALIDVINAIPYNQRIIQDGNVSAVVLSTDDKGNPFFLMSPVINPSQSKMISYYGGLNWRKKNNFNTYNFSQSQWKAYFAYLRNTNQSFGSDDLKILLNSRGFYSLNRESKISFVASNPPVEANSQYKPAMNGNNALLINTANPRESFKISDNSNKLVKVNVPTSLVRQLLNQTANATQAPAAQAPAAQTGRRGRPAGIRNAPAAPQPAAVGGGNVDVSERMQLLGLDVSFMRLPRGDYRKLAVTNATSVIPNGDRGAARRNNQLGNRGNVTSVISIGASKIYFIRLANNQTIASINVQPGNRNYVLFGNNQGNVALSLNSPAELLSALQQRNLAEIHQYLVNEYLNNNPTHLTEFKQLLRKHINEKKDENK